jgi:hypothetical protein
MDACAGPCRGGRSSRETNAVELTPEGPAPTEAPMDRSPDGLDPGLSPGPDIAPIRSRLVHELHDYWDAKRAGRAMPRKSDIDPSEIKPLLPYVLLGEFAADPVRLRYRLVGTEVVTVYGVDFTGRWLDELDFGEQLTGGWPEQYRRVFDSGRPVYGSARLLATSGMEMTYEFGLFPLSQDGAAPTHCLDVNDYRAALRRAEDAWARIKILQAG